MQKWLYDISERIEALQAVLDEQDNESIAPDVKNAIAAIYESDVPAHFPIAVNDYCVAATRRLNKGYFRVI